MYKFKGFDWTELAECWEIAVDDKVKDTRILDENGKPDKKLMDLFARPERIDIKYRVNGTNMIFTTEDHEEVLAEKLKRHIASHMHNEEDMVEIAADMRRFLRALYEEAEKTDYSYPVYKGMLEIESDVTLGQWVIHSLNKLWT